MTAGKLPGTRYAMVYLHDGQTFFNPKTTYGGAAHNETAWKKRVPLALPFLLGR